MAKKKTAGIKKVGDRQFAIDRIEIIDGKRVHIRQSGFSSAQEAREALPSIIEKKRREMNPLCTTKTFNDLCDQFLDYRSTQAKSQTIDGLRYLIAKHITPSFDGVEIPNALTYGRVLNWYKAKCASAEDSSERKNKVFTVFRQIVEFAYARHYINGERRDDLARMVENVRLPNKAKADKAVWTYGQEMTFLSSIPKDSIDFPMFSLFCYLGCRLGEFLGLQWKCLDESQRTITIAQQVIRKEGGTTLSGELKTNESYRIDKLDDEIFSLLMRYRATLNSSGDNEFMFPSPYDSRIPLSRTEFRRRFNHYIEISGVPKIVPHGVRKSKATSLAGVCRNAEEVAVAAKFLGHSSAMFMGTYVSQHGISQSDIISRLKGGDKA